MGGNDDDDDDDTGPFDRIKIEYGNEIKDTITTDHPNILNIRRSFKTLGVDAAALIEITYYYLN
jgi:hypothetical protein